MRQKFITKCVRFFITKCDRFITKCDSYYKLRQFYYKMRVITKCDSTITDWWNEENGQLENFIIQILLKAAVDHFLSFTRVSFGAFPY